MKEHNFNEYHFTAQNKQVTVYAPTDADAPVVYLNMVNHDNGEVYRKLLEMGWDNFNLVTIGGLNWNHDMSPWDAPPVSEKTMPCSGGADEYLELLVNTIIPMAETYINRMESHEIDFHKILSHGSIPWRGIAGYSLAGLFAVYSLYKTQIFSRAASISGSLWFPGFMDYVLEHSVQKKPEKLYFSLGNKEAETRNPYLKTVLENTKTLTEYYKTLGIDTAFEMNPGNHFKDAAARSAKGIAALLK